MQRAWLGPDLLDFFRPKDCTTAIHLLCNLQSLGDGKVVLRFVVVKCQPSTDDVALNRLNCCWLAIVVYEFQQVVGSRNELSTLWNGARELRDLVR